jgi:glycine hydroxymethyltransferase
MTTRGMGEAEAKAIGAFIDAALMSANDDAKLASIRGQVAELCNKYPLYVL